MDARQVVAFVGAWQRADVDLLMSFITDDCIYITTTGPDPGTRYVGREAVRDGFKAVLAEDGGLGVEYGEPFICGNVGLVEWTLRRPDQSIAARGCDLLEFDGDRIRRKDAFRKAFG